ncbi:MAG: hypothetical protein V9G63_10755 [Candidatus Competibacter sp.]
MARLLIFLPLVVLSALHIFSAETISWYFEKYTKEQIAKSYHPNIGFPSEFQPLIAKEAPNSFEIVIIHNHKDGRYSETYYDKYGNEMRVSFHDGKWKGTYTSCTARTKYLWIPMVGFFLYVLGNVIYSIRTGYWVNFSLSKKPPLSWRETVLFIYGMVLFILGVISNVPTCFNF